MKLLIIDSNSIINRAFYGIRNLSTKTGTPTNAIYGFLNILIKLIRQVEPDYICAAFDVKAPTFRHEQFKDYKAQRKPMPDDLAKQIPIAKEILSAMNITVLEKAGYEADDIIGTVSRICSENDVECFIATGDKDDLQLVDDKVRVILTVTRSGMNETVIYDEQAVYDKYSVTPTEFIDVKALMGDPSDNIPGVAGVGEKTAVSLISKYHSIEYIYENIDNVGLKGAMYKKMVDGKDMAFMSKQLATIDKNVPMDINIADYKVQSADNDTLYELLSGLELFSTIKKLELSEPQNKTVTSKDFFEDTEINAVTDIDGVKKLASAVEKNRACAILFELSNKNFTAVNIAVGKTAYCITIGNGLSQQAVFDELRPILESEKTEKYMYDVKDALVSLHEMYGENIVKGIAFDGAIAIYLIDPSRTNYDIISVAGEYLGVVIEAENEGEQMSLFDEQSSENIDFSGKKVLCIEPLMEIAKKKMDELGQNELYYNVELPLVEVLADMQVYGFKIDQNQLDEFGDMLGERIAVLTKEIYNYANEEFNINSPKQLGVILFEKLGLKVIKKTKTGYSTNAEVLEKLKGEHPIIDLIMEYRQLAKLKSTYCDGLKAVINPKTGRIHSVFTQTVTVTGRISSTEPNMQNIPTRTEIGRELRKMFVAEGEDYILTDADYSQIELRVLAHIADDQTMIDAFLSGEDIHTVTASQVFGVPTSDVTGEQRRSAKAVNFGIVYGIGEFSLSQDLKISVGEAKRYIQSYLDKYSGVHHYMEHIKEQAHKQGYVKTLLNRIRYIPELASSNHNLKAFGERVALNTPIQGTAADIIKLAMVRVHKRLKDEGLKSRLILQVHDELIVETLKSEQDKVKEILKTEMENAMDLKVPLIADMACGKSWYDAK